MAAATQQVLLAARRMYSEPPHSFVQAKKLRVVQLGSYPTVNRGARNNLLTIHQRLLARGHESTVIDLTPHNRVKQSGVIYPKSMVELARLLLDLPADVVHFHLGSALTLPKLALAAMASRLPEAKKICTLHLGGRFYPKKGLCAWRWGATGAVLRQFDRLIAVSPEIVSFFEGAGVKKNQVHLITPFRRLRLEKSVTLSSEIETFYRKHSPLIVSVGDFEPGSELPKQFDILSMVRKRYPSAGLLAIGGGSLHFKYAYERALHHDANHIELTGALSETAVSELIQRANVLLQTDNIDSDSFEVLEARKNCVPVVMAYLPTEDNLETAALQVLRSLQIARPQYEDASAALTDGVDDVIRLYKQMAPVREEFIPLSTAYEWPNIGWGL